MKKNLAIVAIALVAILATPFILSVSADTSDISIKWYIPSDLGISISYPTGLSDVQFKPTSDTFSGQDAYQQTAVVRAFNVTNTGNVNIDLKGNFTADLPAGITFFNLSTVFATENMLFWVPANDTTQRTIKTALTVGSQQGFWAWSSGTNVANTSYPLTKSFRITSSAS